MPRRPALHSVDDLAGPGLEQALAALGPPPEDAGLVALARVLAGTLDKMSDAERRAMLGQTVPAYFRCLVELEKRAAARREPAGKAGNPIAVMRTEHARRRGAS